MKVMTYYAGVMYIARPGCGGQRTCVYGARGPRATTAPRVSGVTCVMCENVSRGAALSRLSIPGSGGLWRRRGDELWTGSRLAAAGGCV